MADISGKRVALVVDDYFEQVEFTKPKQALEAAGAQVDVISPQPTLHGLHHVDAGDTFNPDVKLDSVDFAQYDALVLPGGAVNADSLRMSEKVQTAVTDFLAQGKTVAAICHAPWVLVSADVVRGRTLTSFETVQDDIRNAGGEWVDRELVVDKNLITSRKPDDIPAFNTAIIEALAA